MKYVNRNDFAEKVINNMPFVQGLNIKVEVTEYSISYTPIKGRSFFGGREVTSSFMDTLGGIINGLRYGYDILKKDLK